MERTDRPAGGAGPRWRDRTGRHPRVLATLVLLLSLVLWTAVGWTAWLTHDIAFGLPDRAAISGIGDMAQATTIYDARDEPVFTVFKEQRIEVPFSKVSPQLVQAVLAIEDQRFYDHRGVDLRRISGAALANVREWRAAQGGSTITQQLARQSLLTREKTLRRKLKEVALAAQLEAMYTKQEILELYLNKVYFGDGFYGVEAAARGLFGKPAADLGLEEAALLAGLIRSPSAYAPSVNLDRAIARRNVVLGALADVGIIDQPTLERMRAAPVELRNALHRDEPFGLYVKEHVRREIVERFGWQRVYEGGLRVYTTMEPDLQIAAEKAVEEGLRRIESRAGYAHPPREQADAEPVDQVGRTDYLQAALVAIDPRTGRVLAMVGGRDFAQSHFNRAVQARRQPGSAFKPFVFAAALESGLTPASLIGNLDDPFVTAQGAWLPDDGHSSATEMTLRTALRISSNRAAVQLLRAVGIPEAVKYSERLRVGAPPPVPSLVLGSGELTPIVLTAGYAAFANGGLVNEPVVIRRVEDRDGEVLFEHEPNPTPAISEITAFLMASMLADVVNAGTGSRARREGLRLPAAGKTGTTNDFVDAWFVGFTPRIVTGVWIGFDQPRTILAQGYASDLAVPLWATFMKAATSGHKPEWFDRPAGVVALDVCRVSGRRPGEGCDSVEVISDTGERTTSSHVYTEFFARGTEPRETCTLHPARPRTLFGRIAGVFGAGDRGVQAEEIGVPVGSTLPGPPEPARADRAEQRAEKPEKVEPGEPEQRRRGFWSRVFGFGRGKDKEERREEERQRPPR